MKSEERDRRRQMERESRNIGRDPVSQRHRDPSPLSTFNGPRGGLGREKGGGGGVLKYSPARRAGGRGGGAGPAGAGRGGRGAQLHLQERTIMLDSCSTLGLRPT